MKRSEKSEVLSLNYSGLPLECGCDEAGRGCLAGAVVAAAVILPPDFDCSGLNDSKKMTEKQRYAMREVIEQTALAYAVAFVSEREIDQINILNASILAMHKAVEALSISPDFIIVDGNRFKDYATIPHQTIVKGDSKFAAIAAASVLAKTYRDDYMQKLHEEYPIYFWNKNKGYPTKAHRESIATFGTTPYHRQTFRLLPEK